MEQLGKKQSIEIDVANPPEALEAKSNTDLALEAYSSKPENNPLSQAFMEKYGIEYSDHQALAENPDKPSPEISIVIPVHNEGEGIIGLLESLVSQASDRSAEILLVINNDTVGTRNIIDKAIAESKIDGSKLRLVDCSYETKKDGEDMVGGVGLARKIGMDFAVSSGAKFIVSLDADCTVEKDFLNTVLGKTRSGVDGLTYEIVPVAKDEKGEKYLDAIGKIRKYRATKGIAESWTPSTGDPVTGAVHIVNSEIYAKAGGMSTMATGEDGRFGESVGKTGARILDSGIKVKFALRESETPNGQGAAFKEYNQTQMIENPDNPDEKMNIDEAILKMESDKEFQAIQEKEKRIEEITKKLIQELIIFFNDNKKKLQTLEVEDIDLIKEKANNSPLINKYLLSSENDFSQFIGALKDSITSDQFILKLIDKLGNVVKKRIKDSIT